MDTTPNLITTGRDGLYLAIAEMICAGAAFAIMTAIAKVLTDHLPPTQIAFARMFVNLLAVAPWLLAARIPLVGSHHRLLFTRSAAGAFALCLNFSAAAVLPLSDLGAIVKSGALFTVVFGMLLLGEVRSMKRILLTVTGFLGVWMVLRPSFDVESLAGLEALGTAFLTAVGALAIRQLRHYEHPLTVVFHFSAFGSLLILLVFGSGFVLPTGTDWILLVGCGLSGTVGQILVTRSLQRAPASMVAPYSFIEVLFAMLLGTMLFSEHVPLISVLGSMVIVGSGIVLARSSSRAGG